MPYIPQDARARIDAGESPRDAGELNYAVTRLVDAFLGTRSEEAGRLRYAHLNEAIGVLECAKLELYRRVAAPYEDRKRDEAGDVYEVGGGEG